MNNIILQYNIITQKYNVPLVDVCGVTQVDEKGHEGNTAVVVGTAYLCWRKHGQRSRTTGVPAHYYYLL